VFTGIVEELGEIAEIHDLGDSVRLTVRADIVLEDVALGDSVAVNGCCLTVATLDSSNQTWTADVMAETLDKTSLSEAMPGDRVNLERAVTASTRLGGHLVQGHVDGPGRIAARTSSEHWDLLEISIPPDLSRYLVAKGSVCVDGVSLTVMTLSDDSFTVSLIPETLARTTLGLRSPGERVNLEVDIIAKYVERLLAPQLSVQHDHSGGQLGRSTEGVS
jgi:riboflavin synthase